MDYDQFMNWHASTFGDTSDGESPITLPAAIHAVRRQFSIDLLPEMVFNTGPLVSCLMTSGVGKYMEFRTVQKFLVYAKNKLHLVYKHNRLLTLFLSLAIGTLHACRRVW